MNCYNCINNCLITGVSVAFNIVILFHSGSGVGFSKCERLLLPGSDSDESDSPNFCSQSDEALPNYCNQSDDTSTNYCVDQSGGDVLLSGADTVCGEEEGHEGMDSPSVWDPATDDSLGGGEMAPLNLAGPQDLSTGVGKQV